MSKQVVYYGLLLVKGKNKRIKTFLTPEQTKSYKDLAAQHGWESRFFTTNRSTYLKHQ